MKKWILVASVILVSGVASAEKSPKFNTGKMKPDEVFKKCGEWAGKEVGSMKDIEPDEYKAKYEKFNKLANSCSLNNGFDAKGDRGNELWIKYGRRN